MTRRAAIYARISKAEKKIPKVSNQIATCKAIAADEGWTVDPAHIFKDDGIAASGIAVEDTTLQARPGALACLEALRRGDIDVLIAVEGERLARTYLDGLQWIQASADGKVTWHLDTDGVLDPSTPAGEETAVSIFASGRREGRVRSARQKRRYDSERASGLPTWGVRPYGFLGRQELTAAKAEDLGWEEWEEGDQYFAIHPDEAQILRQAILNVTSGAESIWGVASRWTKQGVVSTMMGRERDDRTRPGEKKITPSVWTAAQVKQLLIRERNAGILMHRGVELPFSRIEPIVTREEHEALLKAIAQRNLLTPQKKGPKERYLLSGIIECICGEKCYATISYSQRRGGPRNVYTIYRCRTYLTDKKDKVTNVQKHTSINTNIADPFIARVMFKALTESSLGAQDDTAIQKGLADVARRIEELQERLDHVNGLLLNPKAKLTHAAAFLDLAQIEQELEQLDQERNTLMAQQGKVGALAEYMDLWRQAMPNAKTLGAEWFRWLEQDTFDALWKDHPFDKKRDMIRAALRIKISAGGRGEERLQVSELLDRSPLG